MQSGVIDSGVSYYLNVRTERPIQGCELTPNPYVQLKGSAENAGRARNLDPNNFIYSFVWKRGPKSDGCCNPNCPRKNNYEPINWSKAALGGPELMCNVCTNAGYAPHDSIFCSKNCLLTSWAEHSKRHTMIRKISSLSEVSLPDNEDEVVEEVSPVSKPSSEWVEVCKEKTYTPSADDVGCRLCIEITANFVQDNTLAAGPVVTYTEPVLMAPTGPLKRSLATIAGSGSGLSGAVRFRLISYNILAEIYATKQAYPYCDMWNLSWPYRRKILFDELVEMQGDVVCLQEVQADHYEQDISPFMISLGYDGIYKPKSREFMGQYSKVDGCATFWKKNKFLLVENYALEFNDIARREVTSQNLEENEARKIMNRLNRDNIAQIVVLESLSRSNNARSAGRSMLCVVNTHLYSNHQRADVKLWQTINLIREIQQFLSTRDLALLICGDFNSEPSSSVYKFITERNILPNSPELILDERLRILPDVQNIVHDIHLLSAMNTALGHEPMFSNYTAKFRGTLDYMFYTPSKLRILATTNFPEEQEIRSVSGEGLPSACYPSDHILLCCDVAIVNNNDMAMGGNMGLSSASGKMNNKSLR